MYIPLEKVNDFVFEHFRNVKVSKNGTHFLARCTLCGDSAKSQSKRRFNLDYKNGEPVFQCWNCGKSGSFIKLYSLIKCVSEDDVKKVFRQFNIDDIKKTFNKRKSKKKIPIVPNITYHDYILNDCISVDDKTDGIVLPKYQEKLKEFIISRKTYNHKLYIAYKGKYQGRIIIPIYDDNGHIIYFQGRALFNNPVKYDNPPAEKGSIILNSDKFDKEKYIIITEGFFDATSIGNQGTTCFGSSINDEFLDTLFKKTNKGIIIALDNDEKGIESTEKVLKESKYSNKLKYFLMPKEYFEYKDINMLDGKINNIYDFIVENSYNRFKYIISLNLRRK
jgi:5S rRNA maturation endonuclease (ribonuclease M5)